MAGDGRAHDPGEVDAVVAFAGSTHPAPLWLDRLAEGGRLIMPLTAENWWGFMLRAVRHGDEFDAAAIGWVGIFPCAGGRDDGRGEAALRRRCRRERGRGVGGELPIRALHRGEPGPEDAARSGTTRPGSGSSAPPANAIVAKLAIRDWTATGRIACADGICHTVTPGRACGVQLAVPRGATCTTSTPSGARFTTKS